MLVEVWNSPLMLNGRLRHPGEIVDVRIEIGKTLQKRSLVVDTQELKRQDWFINWANQTCVIIGSGPSAINQDLGLAKKNNCKFIAINDSWKLPENFGFGSDVLFGIDCNWWERNKGVMSFEGLKICTSQCLIGNSYDVKFIPIRESLNNFRLDGNCLAYGGNSGFSAIHLAILFGCETIILVGFDMLWTPEIHWHGPHDQRYFKNPDVKNIQSWAERLDSQKPIASALGVTIIDTCLEGGLRAFPKKLLKEIFP